MSVEMEIPEPRPVPPVMFIVRSTEGHGTWKLTEREVRQLHQELGKRLAELDGKRQAKWAHGEPPSI